MKITIFRNDERVHEWFLTSEDPNEMSILISNCGHGFVRYNIGEVRRMENELDKLRWEKVLGDEDDSILQKDHDFWKDLAERYRSELEEINDRANCLVGDYLLSPGVPPSEE